MIGTALSYAMPYVNGKFLDFLLGNRSERDAVLFALLVASIGVFSTLFTYFAGTLSIRITTRLSFDLLREAVLRFERDDYLVSRTIDPAYTTQRIISDSSVVSSFVLANFISAPLSIVAIPIVLLIIWSIDSTLAVFSIILLIVYFCVITGLRKLLYRVTYEKKAKYDDPNAVMPTTGANNGLKLADLAGVAYDDPKWEQLLDELTVNDLFSLTADGGYHTVGVESIGLSATEDCDGPTGVHSNYNPAAGPSYPGSVMLACTWNQPLAKARGEQIAKECAEINCAGWYAPAMNIHRSAFGGRNFEYYSECGVLSGLTAAAEVSGATENGLICYVKHFAFNDQDNYRQNNICTWLNEQAAREIYLKAFEQPIKAGGMGVMTSMNAVGPVWAGGCKALLTNILRDEWGFHGAVITDAVVSPWYMDGNLAIRTGGTKMLAFNITNEFYRDLNSVGTVTAMRNAAHGTLYALANSFAVTRAVAVPKWVKTTYAVDAVVAIILVAWEICAIRKYRKAKKEDEGTEQ